MVISRFFPDVDKKAWLDAFNETSRTCRSYSESYTESLSEHCRSEENKVCSHAGFTRKQRTEPFSRLHVQIRP